MKDVHGGWPFRSGRRGPRALATTCLAAAMAGGSTLPGDLALGAGAVGTPALVVALAPGLRQASSEAPSGLTATAGTGQVTLRWTASAPGNSFTVYNGTSPDLSKADQVGTVTGTGAVVTGLTGGITYYFWVVSAADSLASNMATATPLAAPGAPIGLTATAGTGQVSLTWTAPVSDGGSPVTRYNVYDGTTAGFTGGAAVASTTGTSVTVTGLTGGTTYYFKVTAVNAVGEGAASTEVLLSGAAHGPQGPGAAKAAAFPAPTGLTATAGDAQVGLTWTAPVSDGGSPVTGYHVYRATSPSFRDKTLVSNPRGTTVTVIGLTNGTTYYFMVAAVNAAGHESQFSGQAPARPEQLAGAMVASLTRPVAPRQLIAMLAAIGITATAGAVALAIWGRRQNSRAPQRPGLHRRTR